MARVLNVYYFLIILVFAILTLSLQNGFSQENGTPQENSSAPTTLKPEVTTTTPNTSQAPQDTVTKSNDVVTKEDSSPITDDQILKDTNHSVIRRIVIFPIFTNNDFRQEADLAWWKVREFLSEQQRFLVATKRFMQQKEVDQPRKQLSIADAIFLAKTLDSDCLITAFIDKNSLQMQAYSALDGQLLWKNSLEFTQAQPIRVQLETLSKKLIQDFLASIPYQGFQIVDPLSPKPLVEEGETIMAKADVGAKSSATQGQKVQWIEIHRTSSAPLFQGGAQIQVIAEGEILSNENQVLTIEIKRARDLKDLDKKSLILIPDEVKRLYNAYAIRKSTENIDPNLALLSDKMKDTREATGGPRPLLVALTAIGNVIAALLLAF